MSFLNTVGKMALKSSVPHTGNKWLDQAIDVGTEMALSGGIQKFRPTAESFGTHSQNPYEKGVAVLLNKIYSKSQPTVSQIQRPKGAKRIALCVGCNYSFDSNNALQGCINDAHHWAELLTRNYGFEVVMMTDDVISTDGRKGWDNTQAPTKTNLLRVLKEIIGQLNPGDCFVWTFSGHGGSVKDRDGDDKDGHDETICLPDEKKSLYQMTDDDLYRKAVCKVPEGAKMTAIFDCCHSGGALDLEYKLHTSRDSRGHAKVGSWNHDNKTSIPCHGEVVLISGCEALQTSLETKSQRGRGGVLTTEMVKLLAAKPYGWTFVELLTNTIHNIYQDPSVQRAGDVQCPTLTSSIKFDLDKRAFSPDQLSGCLPSTGGEPQYLDGVLDLLKSQSHIFSMLGINPTAMLGTLGVGAPIVSKLIQGMSFDATPDVGNTRNFKSSTTHHSKTRGMKKDVDRGHYDDYNRNEERQIEKKRDCGGCLRDALSCQIYFSRGCKWCRKV